MHCLVGLSLVPTIAASQTPPPEPAASAMSFVARRPNQQLLRCYCTAVAVLTQWMSTQVLALVPHEGSINSNARGTRPLKHSVVANSLQWRAGPPDPRLLVPRTGLHGNWPTTTVTHRQATANTQRWPAGRPGLGCSGSRVATRVGPHPSLLVFVVVGGVAGGGIFRKELENRPKSTAAILCSLHNVGVK